MFPSCVDCLSPQHILSSWVEDLDVVTIGPLPTLLRIESQRVGVHVPDSF